MLDRVVEKALDGAQPADVHQGHLRVGEEPLLLQVALQGGVGRAGLGADLVLEGPVLQEHVEAQPVVRLVALVGAGEHGFGSQAVALQVGGERFGLQAEHPADVAEVAVAGGQEDDVRIVADQPLVGAARPGERHAAHVQVRGLGQGCGREERGDDGVPDALEHPAFAREEVEPADARLQAGLGHALDESGEQGREHRIAIGVERRPGQVLRLERQEHLLYQPPLPEGLALGVAVVALDDGLAVLLVAVTQHQRPHAQTGRPQPVRVRVVAHVQPAVPTEVVAVAQQFESLARGLGQEGVGRRNHRVHLVTEAGMADQPLQVGGGQVDVGDHQHPLAGGVQAPQPVHQPGAGHEHGVLDGQFVVGHLVEQGIGVLVGEDALQGPAHEVRVAGLRGPRTAGWSRVPLALLDLVAQPLHLRPRPGEPGLGRARGDV